MITSTLYVNNVYHSSIKFVEDNEIRERLIKIKDGLLKDKPIHLLDESLLHNLIELKDNKRINSDTRRLINDIINILKDRRL